MAASRVSAWWLSPRRSTRSAPSRAPRAMPRCSCKPSPAPIRATPPVRPVPFPITARILNGSIKGLRIGVPEEYWVEGTQPGVEQAVRAAIDVAARAGRGGQRSLAATHAYGVPVYYIIAPAEASANLARYDGVKYGYSVSRYRPTCGRRWRRRGNTASARRSSGASCSAHTRSRPATTMPIINKPRRCARSSREDFERAFEQFDVLVSPTSPTVAFKIGEISDPYQMYLQDVFTIPANLAGICGVSVPAVSATACPSACNCWATSSPKTRSCACRRLPERDRLPQAMAGARKKNKV